MRAEEQTARLERFETLCREQGLSLTVQRRATLRAVLESEDHPTADDVYERIKGRVPGVSRTTVYRVLDTLVNIGVIGKVCHPGAAARFDPKVHQHHHLVCLRCDKIVDIEDERLNAIDLAAIPTHGFRIDEFHMHLRGVCPACQKRRPATGRKTSPASSKMSQSRSARSKAGKSRSKKRGER